MTFLLPLVLGIYALPLLAVALAAFFGLGGPEHSSVYAVGDISQFYQSNLAVIVGNLITPAVAAFSITTRTPQSAIPTSTKLLFLVLAALYVISLLAHAQLKAHDGALQQYGPAIAEAFYSLTTTDAVQVLTFIALTAGITLKGKTTP